MHGFPNNFCVGFDIYSLGLQWLNHLPLVCVCACVGADLLLQSFVRNDLKMSSAMI